MLGAFFPNAVMIAFTATANFMDRVDIEQSLHMSNPVEIIGNPDRRNIFYSKILRGSDELQSYEAILRPIADQLLEDKVNSISSPVPVTPEFHEKHAHAYSVNLHVAFSVDRHGFLFSIAKLDFILKNKR